MPSYTSLPLTLLACLVLALGCAGDDKADTGSAVSGEVTSATTGGTTGSTATTTETTGGSDATTTSATTTTATTEDTAATTMGGDASTHLESCEAACDVRYACFPDIFTSKAECIEICLEEAAGFWPTSECFGALGAFNHCIAGLTCQEITADGCSVEADDAYNRICVEVADPQCENSQGSAGGTCFLSQVCSGSELKLDCNSTECTCYKDGIETDKCPGLECSDPADIKAMVTIASDCCGLEL
ncbi:MAG TPA: hypothetical protein PKW35_13105 [Nannocystaceae bacterium]|nr:hypothetical protein [Nannocystaceae bacterium]